MATSHTTDMPLSNSSSMRPRQSSVWVSTWPLSSPYTGPLLMETSLVGQFWVVLTLVLEALTETTKPTLRQSTPT